MDTTRLATMAAVLLALAAPAVLAQGANGGRGPSNRQPSDAGPGGRDAVSHAGGATPRHETRPQAPPPPPRTLWSDNASIPLSPFARGLVGGGLMTPRPGIDLFRAAPGTYAGGLPGAFSGQGGGVPGRARGRERSGGWRRNGTGAVIYPLAGGVFATPYAYWPYGGSTAAAAPPDVTAPDEPSGFLRLLVTPRRTDVIVDGIYEGTVDDFGGTGERTLPSGVHRVRLESEGYEPVEFDVRVPDNDTITLRRDLYPRSAPTPPPVAAAPTAPGQVPKVIYAIPRCYLGDTPPRQDQLPAGCNIADLRTLD